MALLMLVEVVLVGDVGLVLGIVDNCCLVLFVVVVDGCCSVGGGCCGVGGGCCGVGSGCCWWVMLVGDVGVVCC